MFDGYLDRIFESGWLSNNGPLVQELERRIADTVGVDHCIAVSNGTVALEVAARAMGLSGEVIVPAFTFVATAHALEWLGVTPVFADIDPETQNIDPVSVRSKITARTSGILAVHLWGRPAPIEQLQALADEFGIRLLFDAAHAFGVSHRGNKIGTFGDAEVFSFHATKFFNTFEGGAVLTNNGMLAERVRLLRNFGFAGEDNVVQLGINGKLSEVHAAMGLTNLDAIDAMIARNLANYEDYSNAFADIPGVSILPYNTRESNNYQYIVALVDDDCAVRRDEILDALRAENVLARRYFWPGIHRMEPYASRAPEVGYGLPVTDDIASRVIVLPTGTAVDLPAILVIAGIVRAAVRAQQVGS